MGALRYSRVGDVLTLEISNPRKANALDMDILRELERQTAAVEADPSLRVVVLRGMHAGTFSAGADIRQWSAMSAEQFGRDWVGYGNQVFRRFEALRCPTVAVIEGACVGGGFELALCADIRLASTSAQFRFPEVGIGAFPGWEGGARLARICGRARALDAVLTMRTLDADTAEHWGLVAAIAAPADVDERLDAIVRTLVAVSPAGVALAKASILTDEDPLTFYPAAAARGRLSADAEIGIRAFIDKTVPHF